MQEQREAHTSSVQVKDKRKLGRGFWMCHKVLINGEKEEAALNSHTGVMTATLSVQSKFPKK